MILEGRVSDNCVIIVAFCVVIDTLVYLAEVEVASRNFAPNTTFYTDAHLIFVHQDFDIDILFTCEKE